MSEKNDKTDQEYVDWGMKNWRSWGSWFSWGSPVGLSIFLLSLSGCVWILVEAFKK